MRADSGISATSVIRVLLCLFFLLTPMLKAAEIAAEARPSRQEPVPEQQRGATALVPIEVDDNFLQGMGAQTHSEPPARMSTAARAAMSLDNVLTVPHFSSSFNHQGQPYRYVMVGGDPHQAATTQIRTQIIPIALTLQGYEDANGDPLVLDVAPVIEPFRNSPSFRRALYGTGFTQFGDAVQRAEFFHAMDPDWHTLLTPPAPLIGVNIDVPRGQATLYRNRRTGALFAIVDDAFFISHLNTILQLQNLDPEALIIALTSNVFLSSGATVQQCCTVGFHTAFDAGVQSGRQVLQTFVWASWVEPGIFGPNFVDVTAATHEISEWMNDPFGSNQVPPWQYPNGAGGCQNNLEPGDPLEGFANLSSPVTIDQTTFHPQSVALLQWFTREKPSGAVDGVYSFPDGKLLTEPSQGCKGSN